ncbi:MAG: GNAT family N-acetyltransferase [Pseudomonadota bacterium]
MTRTQAPKVWAQDEIPPPPPLAAGYELSTAPPAAEEYLRLREIGGLGAKSLEGARIGLANSLYCVTIRREGRLVSMCRVVGDGGCHYAVVDAVTDPAHRSMGFGALTISMVRDWFYETAPDGAYCFAITTLTAFVAPLGYAPVEPDYRGVFLWKPMSGETLADGPREGP